MLTATFQGRPVGWGQWYRWADYPAAADAMQAFEGECGIDYAIGNDTDAGHGLGTELVAALVQETRRCAGQHLWPCTGSHHGRRRATKLLFRPGRWPRTTTMWLNQVRLRFGAVTFRHR
jgi:hypothetical protein